MKKVLILGGGFTAHKRLDERTLAWKKTQSARGYEPRAEAMAMLPNDHHPGPRCSCRDCLDRYPRCPTCGTDDTTATSRHSPGGWVDCEDAWHQQGRTAVGSHNAPLVNSPAVEHCPDCHSSLKLGGDVAMDDIDCLNGFHFRQHKSPAPARCPDCGNERDQWKGRTSIGKWCANVFHSDADRASSPHSCPECHSMDKNHWHRNQPDKKDKWCGNAWHDQQNIIELVNTIDSNKEAKPTWVHNLDRIPWPCNCMQSSQPGEYWGNSPDVHKYDEVHAYEILEHLGTQGDASSFFAHFAEIWMALKPGGLLFASVPSWKSQWAWADPSHRRVITAGTLVFLMRAEYDKQLGKTAMSDFRHLLVGDWELVNHHDDGESYRFVLRAK